MWRTDTLWFDVALVMSIFAVGGVLFGHFEQHKPRARRILKQVLVLAFMLLLDVALGREWLFAALGVAFCVVVYVHAIWLPKHGINGWTAEPYDKYLALVTRRSRAGTSP